MIHQKYSIILRVQTRDGTGQDFLDPTRPVNFKIIAGRLFFFTEGFCSLFIVSNKKFSKGGGGDMSAMLKFVTLHGNLRKKT